MPTQSRVTIATGSGKEGIERETRYNLAYKKANKPTFAEWARSVLDKEADQLLGKVPA